MRKTWRNRKSTTCANCWLKSVLHEKKRRTGSDSGQTNATKTVSDVFQHWSRTVKSYCRTKSDVGSERVNLFCISHCINCVSFVTETIQTSHTQHYVLYIQMVLDDLINYIQHSLSFNRPLSWAKCDFHIRRRPTYGDKSGLWTILKFLHIMLRKTQGL
jgi:hypothetical protein